MLGFICAEDLREADRILTATARTLRAGGHKIAGVVQLSPTFDGACPRRFGLEFVDTGLIRVFDPQRGLDRSPCALASQNIVQVADEIRQQIEKDRPQLLFLSRFDRVEIGGGGFRSLLECAVKANMPVLTCARATTVGTLLAVPFSECTRLSSDLHATLGWARMAMERFAG